MAESPGADRILVIRLGALGDVVRTLPAVASLRAHYPGALITWLVEPAAMGALTGQGVVDDVMVFPRDRLQEHLGTFRPLSLLRDTLRFVRELRGRRFDLVLDFHGIFKSGVLAWLSGAPQRVGYAPPIGREQGWRFSNRRAVLTPGKMSRFARNEGLVGFLGVAPGAVSGPFLRLPSSSATRAAELRDEPMALIHPGTSSGTPYKRYTVEGYAEVARALRQRAGLCSWVTHGPAPGELEFAQQVVHASRGAARLAPRTPEFADLMALLAGARVFIGSDSGPLHAASLLETPVVQLLGPTDPVENAPFEGTPSRSLRVPVVCSPCRRGCAAATCMRVIPSERVVVAALELLSDHARSLDAAAAAGSSPDPTASSTTNLTADPTANPSTNPTTNPTGSAAARAVSR